MYQHGKFRSTTSAHHNPSAGEKTPPASSPKEKGKAPMEEHGTPPEHVTKTHPGETQPHASTGVHAVHVHHTGGGKFMTHHHHEDGTVETQHHENADEAHAATHETLPGDSGHEMNDQNEEMGGQDFSETLGGIGGGDSY